MPQATPGAASEVVRFDEFEADLQSGELRKAGHRIKLQHQPFQLLRVLLERPGELISREELQRRLWPDGTIVEFDHSLNTALKKIRQALGDPAGSSRFIETVPRRGYRFIRPVSNGRRDMPGVAALARRQILFRFRLLIATVGVLAGTYWLLRPADDARHEPVIVQLTSYPTLEKHPSLSPDGNQVAFSWNGPEGDNFDIYVKQVDGQIPLRLTTDLDSDVEPAWSPDGRWIAFQRPGVGIFLVSPLGGRERKVAGAGTEPSWTPDSKSLVFIAGGLPDRPQAVFQMVITTGERKQLTSPPRGYWGDAHPAVSPDSKTLAFTRTRQPGVSELLLQPLARGEARPAMQEVARIAGIAWTPDGNEIIFASDRRGASRLWRVAPDGRPRPVVAVGDPASSPALSRAESGRAVLLVYERSFAATDIHLTTLNDNGRAGALQSKPLIESTRQEWHPRFSANGTKIAFVSDRAGTAQVWTCQRDGSNCTQMTSFEVAAFAPQWSPDDRFLAFSGNPSAATRVANVFVMGLEGGQLRQLTHDRDSDALVRSWSADGLSVYFHSSRGGEQRIWKLAVAGGAAVPVTKREAIDGRESADGKWFYFIGPSPKNLAASGPLWRVPVGGGREERVLDGLSFFRWEVTPLGIYFVELSATPGDPDLLKRFSFETGRISSVGSLQQRASRSWSGFSATPDGTSFLTVHDQPRTSDLMLLKSFR